MPEAPSPTEILEDALTDVAIWHWWAEKPPTVFQIEFIGPQLRRPELAGSETPTEAVALRFGNPRAVAFLTRGTDLPSDWPAKLAADELDYQLGLAADRRMVINRPAALPELLAEATSVRVHLGDVSQATDWRMFPVSIGFWARDGGLVVGAETIHLVTAERYEIDVAADWHQRWWDFWRDYWAAKDDGRAYPYDWTCESCIPLR